MIERRGAASAISKVVGVAFAVTLVVSFLVPTFARAQSARDLAVPWRAAPQVTTPQAPTTPSLPTPPSLPTAPLAPVPAIGGEAEIQDIHPASSTRRYGDGHEGDVPWSDPELDLRPAGYVHGGLFGMGGVITATSHTPVSPDLALGMFVDIALEPHLSLHLRVGALARGRLAGDVLGADGRRGSQASLIGRGFALIGAHFFQILAVRIGFEVGGSAVLGAARAGSGVGWAAVLQLGVRFDDGHVEIVIDGAIDSHEVVVSGTGVDAQFGDQPAPRLTLGLIGEFG